MRAWRRPRPYPFHGSAWRLTSRNFATRGRREYATATDSAAGARVCRFDAMASTKKETAGGSIVNVRVLIYLGGEIASIPGAAGEREGHWRAHMEDRWGLQLKASLCAIGNRFWWTGGNSHENTGSCKFKVSVGNMN
ncbi:hypothetical protein BDA96_K001100 [Sorghum bicolor]|uniref:Uncharacterized protein n=2 Tax=Sorghum bicolor TaxID=4558 RepID=A0A921Q0M7_SORBI|nr:uncharacterized protein LOC110429797 isoform X2 [Sorghum bicolor]KAG0381274.1 hypothetical protein BDA96_K001100 [Sorghum bicolor]OQU79023.1 hypothetical protein SORBI_3008G088833 [Sorghum bicolor]|eukprot:XP_021302090.1 uncharacterized protein LOC110429797 isoform X2 [Sorghum bicolor]